MQQVRQLPELPRIGMPESHYARQVHLAEKIGDPHLRESNKVAQYVTLALEPRLCWSKKLKYFDHALRRHCIPPPLPDDDVWLFYQQMSNLVRAHTGEQALKLACAEDDAYDRRLHHGEDRAQIVSDARHFFYELMTLGNDKPCHFNEEDWIQLKLIRDQWV
jgi:hypothetical protein